MRSHRVLYLTHRAERFQRSALEAAPDRLELEILRSPTREQVLARLPAAEFLVSERQGTIDAEMIAAGRHLRLIQRLGSQVHDIDLAAAARQGVPVCCWPIESCVMVAEHVMMQILALAKRAREGETVVREAATWGHTPAPCDENHFLINWSGRTGIRALRGATVGIVGYGEIGGELARRLRCFDCRILYHKRSPLPASVQAERGIVHAALDDLLAAADFVCVLLPDSPATRGSVNAAFVARMKRGACLVCTGASTLMEEGEIAASLADGRLGGLAADGYRWEPVRADNPLLALLQDPMANVVLTPHTAGGERPVGRDIRAREFTNLLRVLDGGPLMYRQDRPLRD